MYFKSTMFIKQWLILLNIILLLVQPATCNSNITCSAGVATIGGPAKVTCNFNRDIKSTQTNFVIWKFPIDIKDLYDSTFRKDILNCNWVKEKLNCITADGYAFEEHTVGTTASVDIPSATADQKGIYKCQLATQEIIPISTCNLAIQAKEGNQVSQDISSFISDLTPTGAFILIVGLVLVSFFFIFVTTFLCHKNTCRRKADHEVQTTVDSAERSTNTIHVSTRDFVDIGTNTEDLHGQQSAVTSPKGKSNGLFSRKEEIKPKHNIQSFDNILYTHNEGISSLSNQPAKSQSIQTLPSFQDREEQQQPLLPPKLYPPLPQEGPLTMDPMPNYQATSDLQPLHRESHEEEVGSGRVDTLVNLGTIDDVSEYDHQGTCQNDPDTSQDDNGKGPKKEKKRLMRKALSLFTKL